MLKYICLLFLFIVINLCSNEKDSYQPNAKSGKLDFRSHDFNRDPVVDLGGEWEFYWKQFIPPKNSQDKILPHEKSLKSFEAVYMDVPSQWQNNGYPIDGYATYRLEVVLPSNRQDLAIQLPDIATAYRLYINGKLLTEIGRVSDTKEDSAPFMKNLLVKLPSPTTRESSDPEDPVEILLHVSNYDEHRSGIWINLKLGTLQVLESSQNRKIAIDLIVFSALFIMGLYHLGIFFHRRKDKTAINFGIFCLLIGMRTINIKERLITEVFPNFPFLLIHKIEYFSFFFGSLIFIYYVAFLFPEEFSKRYLKYFSWILIPASMSVLLLPMAFYSRIITVVHITALIGIFYITKVIISGIIYRKLGAKLFLFGWILFASSVINDILLARSIISTVAMTSYGLITFVFFQATILSRRFAMGFEQAEKFSIDLIRKSDRLEETTVELNELMKNLENKVSERTKDLLKAKEEVEEMNSFLKSLNEQRSLKSIIRKVGNFTKHKFGFTHYALLISDKNQSELKFFGGVLPSHISKKQKFELKSSVIQIDLSNIDSIHTKAILSQKALFIEEIENEIKTETSRQILDILKHKSQVILPLFYQNKLLGTLEFFSLEKIHISDESLKKLEFFGEQLTGIINSALLLIEVKEEKEQAIFLKIEADAKRQEAELIKQQTEELNKLIKSLSENMDLKKIMQKVFKYVHKNFGIESYSLMYPDKNHEYLCVLDCVLPENISPQEYQEVINSKIYYQNVKGAHAYSILSKKPYFIKNLKIKKRNATENELKIMDICNYQSILIIPLFLNNKLIATFDLSNSGKQMELKKEEFTRLSILGEQLSGLVYSSNLFREIEEEKEKSEKLLLNILPKEIALELKESGTSEPVLFENVSVLFTDFKGFTKIAESMKPNELVKELDACFVQFDKITERYNLEKLKTIGDSYMCAGGIPRSNQTHAIDTVLAALEIQSFMNMMKELKEMQGFPYWELRLGIHSGSLVAGVIGEKKFAYDVWGDTVNTASRMESSGTPGKVNISGSTYELVKNYFECEYRGKVNAKNKGEIEMYYVNGLLPEYCIEDNKTPNDYFKEIYNQKQLSLYAQV